MKVVYDLDILKPHMPSVDLVARTLMEIEGMIKVEIKVDELDQQTASLHIIVRGINLLLDEITEVLASMNCALHSVDQVDMEKDD